MASFILWVCRCHVSVASQSGALNTELNGLETFVNVFKHFMASRILRACPLKYCPWIQQPYLLHIASADSAVPRMIYKCTGRVGEESPNELEHWTAS